MISLLSAPLNGALESNSEKSLRAGIKNSKEEAEPSLRADDLLQIDRCACIHSYFLTRQVAQLLKTCIPSPQYGLHHVLQKGVDKLTWDTQICRSYVSIPNNGQIRHPQTAIHQMLPSLLAIDRSDAQTRHGAQILASLEQGK